MGRYLVFIALFWTVPALAQVQLRGRVVDSVSQKPLSSAHIQVVSKPSLSTLSDSEGYFKLRLSRESWYSKKLLITYVGFDTLKIKINKFWAAPQEVPEFKMINSDYLLKGVNVGTAKPDTVHGSPKYSVQDFEFVHENLLLLTYKKRLQKNAELRYINKKNHKQITKYFLPETPQKFYRDYRGVLYLLMETGKVYQIEINEDEIYLSDVPEKKFHRSIRPVVASLDKTLYFSTFQENYPAFDYLSYHPRDTGYSKLRTIEDELMLELYRSEYKYMDARTKLWAAQKEEDTGIDKEIWIGANYFTQSIYYDELYAPLFMVHDSIYIFDHYVDYLYKHNKAGTAIDSIEIDYHEKPNRTGWQEKMLQDRVTDEVFVMYKKYSTTTLGKMNLSNGKMLIRFELYYKYSVNHKIKNGYVYYIYHPYESPQKKFLYKEKIDID